MGQHGIGDMNENRALLVDYALNNDLFIGGTFFQHKTIHKYTWTSPDGRTCNQIDHLLFSRKWRKSLLDVRGYRGADIQSDHNLMVAKIHLKLKVTQKNNKPTTHKPLNVEKLNDKETARMFQLELTNRFEALQSELEPRADVERIWEKLRTTYREVAEEKLGYKKKKKERWVSELETN